MRRPFIAGNWKMNMTAATGAALIEQLKPLVKDANCDVALCVPGDTHSSHDQSRGRFQH